MDHSVTFAVNWTGQETKDVDVTIQAPDKRCRIPMRGHAGIQIRKGEFYKLIRVELPYDCGDVTAHEGTWSLHAQPLEMSGDAKETIDIMVLGDSRLKLETKSGYAKDEKAFLITARFLKDGAPLRKIGEASIQAKIHFPLPNTGDSEKQDAMRKGERIVKKEPPRKERRVKTLLMNDSGKYGDHKAGDGIFTAAVDVSELPPGLYQTRIVGNVQSHNFKLTREGNTSFFIKH
jgi:hypothetical protein